MVDMSAKVNALMGPSHLLEQIHEENAKVSMLTKTDWTN